MSACLEWLPFIEVTASCKVRRPARAIEAAGGAVEEKGEFVPGEPYLFASDLDGYLFEGWFEIPTSVDPR
jgi:hypothetical protein